MALSKSKDSLPRLEPQIALSAVERDSTDASSLPKRQKLTVQEELSEEGELFENATETQETDEGELAIDVYETERDLVIQAAIAGVRPEALDVSIDHDLVTIAGERKHPKPQEPKTYYHHECFWGPFAREVLLPKEVDVSRAEAAMKDGIFTLRFPKIEREKVKKVQVQR